MRRKLRRLLPILGIKMLPQQRDRDIPPFAPLVFFDPPFLLLATTKESTARPEKLALGLLSSDKNHGFGSVTRATLPVGNLERSLKSKPS